MAHIRTRTRTRTRTWQGQAAYSAHRLHYQLCDGHSHVKPHLATALTRTHASSIESFTKGD